MPRFRTEEDVEFAVESEQIGYQEPIEYEWAGERVLTTPGRVIFNAEVERALDEATSGEFEDHPYLNKTLTKRELDSFIGELVERYGPNTIAAALDVIKSLTFRFATRAGITVSKNDIVIPDDKEEILARFEDEVAKVGREYDRGLMTEEERHERIVAIWTEATDVVAEKVRENLAPTNPIYMMANSGARGSFNQIRQLAGMRGLMADPKGEIIARPIKANFMEGLTVLEYFISTHGARKGMADTALRTADSGYLTRRLVDVSQDVIVREEDCGTDDHIEVPLILDESPNKSVAGRVAAVDIHKPIKDGKPGKIVIIEKGADITMSGLRRLVEEFGEYAAEASIPVRSVLKCRSEYGLCRRCYGTFLATGGPAEIGDAVGIIAAQSIGEPGTQLTMRTFHTGGVAGRGHHARPPACRRDLRGPQPEGRRGALADRGQDRRRRLRPHDQGHRHPDRAGRQGRARRPEGVQLPAAHAPAGRDRTAGRAWRCAERGLDQPGRAPRPEGGDFDRALPRG